MAGQVSCMLSQLDGTVNAPRLIGSLNQIARRASGCVRGVSAGIAAEAARDRHKMRDVANEERPDVAKPSVI